MRDALALGLLLAAPAAFSCGAARRAGGAPFDHQGPATTALPCPAADAGETAADCPWASIARQALAQSADGSAPVALPALLAQRAPTLLAALTAERDDEVYKALWGKSINFDERALGTIVEPSILDPLNALAGVPPRSGRITHAGIEHTFGYLFSVLPTAFGYKRARWVQPDVERGFGLTRGTLGPTPVGGTLFSNVTYLAGHVAFRTEPALVARVERGARNVSAEVRAMDLGALRGVVRLTETARLGGGRAVSLRTDFVPFPFAADGGPPGNTQLLVYSVLDSAVGEARLVTAFPVGDAFVASTLAPGELGEGRRVTTRYNAYVEGLSDATTPVTGSRTVSSPSR